MSERLSFSTMSAISLHPDLTFAVLPASLKTIVKFGPVQGPDRFDLMRLPPELRLIVFAYAMPSGEGFFPVQSRKQTQLLVKTPVQGKLRVALEWLYVHTVPMQLRSLFTTLQEAQGHASNLLIRLDKDHTESVYEPYFADTKPMSLPPLLRANRQIRKEALPVYFADNIFVFDVGSCYKAYCESLAWVWSTDSNGRAAMRNIVIVGQVICLDPEKTSSDQEKQIGLPFAMEVDLTAAAPDTIIAYTWAREPNTDGAARHRVEDAIAVISKFAQCWRSRRHLEGVDPRAELSVMLKKVHCSITRPRFSELDKTSQILLLVGVVLIPSTIFRTTLAFFRPCASWWWRVVSVITFAFMVRAASEAFVKPSNFA
ncbi:hypothetical protein LTR10_002719 [Elasticomyces elasticus]|nr:hypothetical protein LTR10_002719 [Elasticomyces elasticus]